MSGESKQASEPVPPEKEACEACGEYSDDLEEVECDTPSTAEFCQNCSPMYRSLFEAQEQDRCVSCGADESTFYIEMEVDHWPYHLSGCLCSECMNGCYPFVFLEEYQKRAERTGVDI